MARPSPLRVWLLLRGGVALAETLVFLISGVYFVRTLGMSPLQLVLVGTVMELTIFVFELPTGIVADLVSRRLSILIGTAIMGAAFVFIGSVVTTWAALAGMAVWGFGYTFTSGAADAWLADEIGVENIRPAYLRGSQVARVTALVGIGLSVGLALVSLRLPIVAGGVVLIVLAGVLAAAMTEDGFTPAERERGAVRSMAATGAAGARLVRRTPVLLLIFAIAACSGAWSEAYDRLWEAHLLRDVGLPSFAGVSYLIWFGVIGAASLMLTLLVARPVNRRLERAGQAVVTRFLLALDVLLIASVVAFALAGSFLLAIAAIFVTNAARSLAGPLFDSWLNQSIEDSSVRATVMSITSQADAVGQWTGGPAIGAVGNLFGIRAALLAGSLLLAPAIGLYARALRRGGPEPELTRTVEAGA